MSITGIKSFLNKVWQNKDSADFALNNSDKKNFNNPVNLAGKSAFASYPLSLVRYYKNISFTGNSTDDKQSTNNFDVRLKRIIQNRVTANPEEKKEDFINISNKTSPDKQEALLLLLQAKDSDGKARFILSDINELLDNPNITRPEFKLLVNAKNLKGSEDKYRFSAGEISKILNVLNSNNAEFLQPALSDKYLYGLRFDCDSICGIFSQIEPFNKDAAKLLFEEKGDNLISFAENPDTFQYGRRKLFNCFRFSDYEIQEILKVLNRDNVNSLPALLKVVNFAYNPSVSKILETVNSRNAGCVEILANAVDVYGRNRVRTYEYQNILSNSIGTEHLSLLVNAKDKYGMPRLNSNKFSSILAVASCYDPKILKKLIRAREAGRHRFDSDDISMICQGLNQYNLKALNYLLAAKNENGEPAYNSYEINFILSGIDKTNSSTISLIFKSSLFKNKKPDADVIKYILNCIHSNPNVSLAKNSRFDEIDTRFIASCITHKNQKYVETLINSKDENGGYRFQLEHIARMLCMSREGSINEDKDYIDTFVFAKNPKGQYRFNHESFERSLDLLFSNKSYKFIELLLDDDRIKGISFDTILEGVKTADELKRLLSRKDEKGNLLSESEIVIACFLGSYGVPPEKVITAKSVDELTDPEKKALLYYYSSSYNRCDFSKYYEIPTNFPLFIMDASEVDNLSRTIYGSIKAGSDSLPDRAASIAKFYKSLDKLEESLKTVDILDIAEKGLILKYPVDNFILDAENIASKLNETEKQKIYDCIKNTARGNFAALSLEKSSLSTQGKKVLDKIQNLYLTKFYRNNQVVLPEMYAESAVHKELADSINGIIKEFPEFLSIIGRKQHGTHQYTLDVHIIKTMQEAVRDADFNKLSKEDQKVAKLAILFHDVAKLEGVIDKRHEKRSALEAYGYLGRLNLTNRERERVFSLINSHNWLEKVSSKASKLFKYTDKYACIFRRPNDFEIAKIITKADLKAVSDEFYDDHKKDLDSRNVQLIEDKINKIHKTGIWLPQTRIPKVQELKLPYINIGQGSDQTSNKVVTLRDYSDLSQLGFSKGTSPDNFYSIIHCVDEGNPASLYAIDYAHKEGCDGVLSASYINQSNLDTYCDRKFGVIFDVDPCNIAAIWPENMKSGFLKTEKYFNTFIQSNESCRTFYSDTVRRETKSSDSRYGEMYKKLYGKQALTDIKNLRTREIFSKVLKGLYLEKGHNELIVYAPKINGIFVKNSMPEEIPYQLRKYAEEKNLPIIIFGKAEDNSEILNKASE